MKAQSQGIEAGAEAAPPVAVCGFFDSATHTISYVLSDLQTRHCAVIDTVLDYDPAAARTSTVSADALIAHIRKEGLQLKWILETHAHADHLTAAQYIKKALGGNVAIGAGISEVQNVFSRIYNLGDDFIPDGRQFDHRIADGEVLELGATRIRALATPGHTPACMTYVVNDDRCAFVGDTLFMPDFGTARCDFPGGSAEMLYDSIQKILSLPAQTTLYMCHDYGPGGREIRWETTVEEERKMNIHVREGVARDDFVRRRQERDKTLSMPALLLPSVQVNIRAGHLPPAEDNGIAYLKFPIDVL